MQQAVARIPNHDADWRSLARCSQRQARDLLPKAIAERLQFLPLVFHRETGLITGVSGREVTLADKQELQFALGCDVVVETAPTEVVNLAIAAAYRKAPSSAAEFEAKQTLATLVEEAVAQAASDIHIALVADGSSASRQFSVSFRIHGLMTMMTETLPACHAQQLFRRVKVLAGLDITSQERVQEGGFSMTFGGRLLRLRVSFVPMIAGEKMVVRLLGCGFDFTDLPPDLKSACARLGMTNQQSHTVLAGLGQDTGVVLAVGPTGSGKSTTLQCLLRSLANPSRTTISIEDPVERELLHVDQIDMSRLQLSHGEVLKAVLRQDPDTLFVGEIRDRELASQVFTAGSTGHLVLSTLHAGSVFEALQRLHNLSVCADMVLWGLRMIIAQRLLPRNCQSCAEETVASVGLRRYFNLSLDYIAVESLGCQVCNGTGVSERLAVFECLAITERVRKELARCLTKPIFLPDNDLIRQAQRVGYQPVQVAIRSALLHQRISPRTALLACGVAPELMGYHRQAATTRKKVDETL